MTHTKYIPVPCQGDMESLPCGCRKCPACGTLQTGPFNATGNPCPGHTITVTVMA